MRKSKQCLQVRKFMKKWDLTQAEMAQIFGVGQPAVSRWVQDERKITLQTQQFMRLMEYTAARAKLHPMDIHILLSTDYPR